MFLKNGALHLGRLCFVAAISLTSATANAGPCAGFLDVEDTSPFCANVAWMKNRAVTLGCASSLYCPDDLVTRAQMAAFMSRLSPMLALALYDATDSVVGYYKPLPAPSTGMGVLSFAAIPTAYGTYYVRLSDVPNPSPFFRFQPLSTTLFYEGANCDSSARLWVSEYLAYYGLPTDRFAFVVKTSSTTTNLVGFVQIHPGGQASPLSYRTFSDGQCSRAIGPIYDAVEVRDVGAFNTKPPYVLR